MRLRIAGAQLGSEFIKTFFSGQLSLALGFCVLSRLIRLNVLGELSLALDFFPFLKSDRAAGTKTASSTDALNVPLETWQFSNSLRVLTIQFRNGLMVDFRTVSLEAAQGLVTFDPTTSVLTIPALTILAGSGSTSNTQVTKVKLSLPANDLWRLVSVANAQGVDLPVAEPTAPVQEGAVTVTRSTLKSFFGIAAGSYLQLADSTTWIAGSDCAFAKPTGSKITTTTAASGSGLTAVPASTTVTEIPAVPYDTSAVIYRQSGKYWITLPQVQPGACTVDKVFG